VPLSNGAALRLTVAEYYLPSGRLINYSDNKNVEKGIISNVEIKVSVEEEIRLYMQRDRVGDSALDEAVEIIKENKVAEMIKSSTVLSGAKNDKDNKMDKKKE
jgi:C-terminal processing protease CtpA/Prc